jgi:hypothetical protein
VNNLKNYTRPLNSPIIQRWITNGPGKRGISKIVNPTRVISPRANPSGVDNFGYSPIQRAVTVSLYRTNSWNILCNIWIVKVLFQVFRVDNFGYSPLPRAVIYNVSVYEGGEEWVWARKNMKQNWSSRWTKNNFYPCTDSEGRNCFIIPNKQLKYTV